MGKCVFCDKIIENNQFYESNNFRVIYNIAPILPGHSLIIPKNHYTSFLELNSDERQELIDLAHNVTLKLKNIFSATGFDLTIQDGESAGQTVFHLHLHIIPRKSNDLDYPGDWFVKMINSFPFQNNEFNYKRLLLEQESLKFIVSKLRKYFMETPK